MNPFELKKALDSITLLVDTREQETPSLNRRLSDIGFTHKRRKLDFGDYSCEIILPDGAVLSLERHVSIERKMSVDELANCLTSQRKRFVAEFERAKESGAKIYLLVENASFEKIINGRYRSKAHPNSLLSSLFAFSARYNCQVLFCKPETTGRIIREILYREVKEYLNNIVDGGD